MSVTHETFDRIFAIDDPAGVLTITVGHGIDRDADAVRIDVQTRLRDAQHALEESGPAERARALADVQSRLASDLDHLYDPRRDGRGRALFAGLSTGEVQHLDVQVPFEDRVVVRDRPYVRPLVAAIDEGRPAGIAVGTRAGVRILEWSLFRASDLARIDLDLGDAQLADSHGGPVPPNPARGQQTASHREQFEDRIDENRHRVLKDAASTAMEMAHDRHWDRLVVAGSNRVRGELSDLFDGESSLHVIDAGDASWEDRSPGQVAEEVWPLLRSVHRQREQELVGRIQDLSRSGGRGALGVRRVAMAATMGRISHLAFTHDTHVEGYVDEHGGLHHQVDGPTAETDTFTREPWFVERLIERVLATGGKVTRIDDEDASADLAEDDGLAALLRW